MLKDGRIIKLPKTNYENVLVRLKLILDDSSFFKFKIFDYRIKDQLILK